MEKTILGLIVGVVVGLFLANFVIINPVPVDRPIGDGEVKKCTDAGGEFWGHLEFGELIATCSYPSRKENL